MGESGCGKSTLGRAAVGLVAPSAGQVRYRGEPVEVVGRAARPPKFRSLQMVFQDPYASLNPRRRVGRQIADAIRLGTGAKLDDEAAAGPGGGPAGAGRPARPPSPTATRTSSPAGSASASPSPGCWPPSPAAWWPTSRSAALDASAQAQVANLLAGIVAESGLGMLFISHDLSVVRKIADRTVVMYFGRIVESGATERDLGRAVATPTPGR